MARVHHVENMDQAREVYKAVKASPSLLYLDTETTGLLVRSGTQDKARLIQLSVRPWDVAWTFDARDETYLDAITACMDVADEMAAHNLKFDMHVMETYGSPVFEAFAPTQLWDTVWVAHFHDERESRRLKDLATKHLGMDGAEEQRALKKLMKDNGWDWDTVPLRYLVQYGGMDTIMGGELFDLLYPRTEPYAMEAYRREQRLLPYIYKMERKGIKIDMPGLEKMTEEYEAAQEEALDKLAILFGKEVVPKANKDKKDALNLASGVQVMGAFRAMGSPIPNTQAVTFHRIAQEGVGQAQEAAEAILTYKETAKTLSTYLRPWAAQVDEAGRIHPSFNTLGTITGRFSSSDPNFQNITRGHGLRDLLVAEEGNMLVVADYEQMELRQFAHYAEDERMRAAFLSGDDLYQQVADLLGVSRDIGKMITLAAQYGAGWRKTKEQAIEFAYKLGQADRVPELRKLNWQDLTERFHKQYKVRHLQWLTEAQAQRRGNYGEEYIRTAGGRRMRPKMMTKERGPGLPPVRIYIFKDLGNSLIQGSCADVMKESLIALGDAGYGDAMRLTVHDEVVLEVPEDQAEEVLAHATQLMERHEYVPPLTVSGSWARRYGDAK